MSSKARLASVLESILDRLDGIESKLEQAIAVGVDARTVADDARSALVVLRLDPRVTRLEQEVFPPKAAE